ncbi:MAG: phosphoribosylglycinamide formyltransferase [Fusobacteriia bacterium 4572_132]|nr:MAG: phosphoribosylglycinamide formyltransferase [Fusobacteriia bacterium 4572_132]
MKMNIAVLASGNGSNFQAIVDSIKKGEIENGNIKVLISNNKKAFALERAKKEGIEAIYISRKEYNSREEYDKKIVELLQERDIELVVLAGYMMWISKYFVDSFENKILNIHPSLLPAFKGLDAIKKAYDYGVKITGVSVHYVDETEDGGKIIEQEELRIKKGCTLEELEKEIHKIEHKLYPKVVNQFCNKNQKS